MNIINEMAMLHVTLHNDLQTLIGILNKYKDFMIPTRYYERVVDSSKVKISFKFPNKYGNKILECMEVLIHYHFDILENESELKIEINGRPTSLSTLEKALEENINGKNGK